MTTIAKKDLLDMQDYLTNNFPGSLIMPSANKTPAYKHKNGQWSVERFREKVDECARGALILLSSDMIVIDIDDYAWVEEVESRFPQFKDTVICRTKKGKHYYFRRTSDSNFMYDVARNLKTADGMVLPIDTKTVTRTGTSGVISIPPSPGKSWIKALGKYDPIPMPQEFIGFYREHATCEKKGKDTVATGGRDPTDVEQLLAMVSKTRADERDSWIKMGWCLHNICATQEFLNLWINWSKQSPKFIDGECENEWVQMKDHGLGIGSLHMWAKEDNPEKYAQLNVLSAELCNGTHNSVASVAYSVLKDRFVCAVSNGKIWYMFTGTLWEVDRIVSCCAGSSLSLSGTIMSKQ